MRRKALPGGTVLPMAALCVSGAVFCGAAVGGGPALAWAGALFLLFAAGFCASLLSLEVSWQNVVAIVGITALGSTCTGLLAMTRHWELLQEVVFSGIPRAASPGPLALVAAAWFVTLMGARAVSRLLLPDVRGGGSIGYRRILLSVLLTMLVFLGLDLLSGAWHAGEDRPRSGGETSDMWWTAAACVNLVRGVGCLGLLLVLTPWTLRKSPARAPLPWTLALVWLCLAAAVFGALLGRALTTRLPNG